jgi:cell division inhibitor SepF
MANKVMDKLLGFMGYEDVEKEMDEEENSDEYIEVEDPAPRGKRAPVVNLHAQKQMRIVVKEPASFDESQEIVDHIKNRRPVVLNIESVDTDIARRLVDFISGATYALGGHMQKVNVGIFLFTPSNIEITVELQDELSEKFGERSLFFRKNRP